MTRKKLCGETILAIEDIFFAHEIGTREDALNLLKEINPNMPDHLDRCDNCARALEAQLLCVDTYASIPV